MPMTNLGWWPIDYVKNAAVPDTFTRESFEAAMRLYATDAVVDVLTKAEIDSLFEKTSTYLKKCDGIRRMRADRVPEDLRRCTGLLRRVEPLGDLFDRLEDFAGRSFPFSSSYSREVLDQTRNLIQRFNNKHSKNLMRTDLPLSISVRILQQCAEGSYPISFSHAPEVLRQTRKLIRKVRREWSGIMAQQRSIISNLNLKLCRPGFTREIEKYLALLLRKKKHERHLVKLIGAVMAGAGEHRSHHPEWEKNRLRQQLHTARHGRQMEAQVRTPEPEDVQTEPRHESTLTKNKQRARSDALHKKKQRNLPRNEKTEARQQKTNPQQRNSSINMLV